MKYQRRGGGREYDNDNKNNNNYYDINIIIYNQVNEISAERGRKRRRVSGRRAVGQAGLSPSYLVLVHFTPS